MKNYKVAPIESFSIYKVKTVVVSLPEILLGEAVAALLRSILTAEVKGEWRVGEVFSEIVLLTQVIGASPRRYMEGFDGELVFVCVIVTAITGCGNGTCSSEFRC